MNSYWGFHTYLFLELEILTSSGSDAEQGIISRSSSLDFTSVDLENISNRNTRYFSTIKLLDLAVSMRL